MSISYNPTVKPGKSSINSLGGIGMSLAGFGMGLARQWNLAKTDAQKAQFPDWFKSMVGYKPTTPVTPATTPQIAATPPVQPTGTIPPVAGKDPQDMEHSIPQPTPEQEQIRQGLADERTGYGSATPDQIAGFNTPSPGEAETSPVTQAEPPQVIDTTPTNLVPETLP